MVEGAFTAEHLNEFNMITTQLISIFINFDIEVRVLILLSSLFESWNGFVTKISGYARKKMKFNDVQDLILSEKKFAGEN